MVPYQAQDGELERFAPPARKLRRFVSTEAFVNTAKQHTETALDVTQSNAEALTAALVNQMQQEGQKLGVTLFQAKYGTAHAVMADLEETLAKKSGLVEATPPPPTGSC
jgi:predicted secreted acid phosphatase